ncbi:quinone oxidoreductase family protein [Luteimicrobium subarcticum]|uniref:NADPH:quinone reductase-like Zn-dependent oxidoreductase n=1 Tax=Luteimicrobium subarcticum TaxID=620910 RepID=A0A2M8W480_9MICO|nr:zinc-binding alcohol dehydrogenase family protein [Luteimicrobium subarcticum]PJI85723.1 NADPH:quinone reductase-like Zn-dependent oxidoreductase [Luteimicrobium subarcticum]
MKAALVTAFDTPPTPTEIAAPVAAEGQVVLDVVAAGLHPRVRSQADGSHYTSTGALPLVPGIDGVGRDAEGTLRYFILDDDDQGSFAERVAVDARRTVPLPDGTDPVVAAAAMNPAMSSWVALRRRITFEAGQQVLVLGATGSAGRMAVQVAKRLGAGRVVAAGRNPQSLAALPALGADETVSLVGDPDEVAGRLAAAAADVDVVVDYVWGATTAAAMVALVTARADRGKPLTWVEVGSVGGREATIPSAALRAARLAIVGSGQGSVTTRGIVGELGALADELGRGTFTVDAQPVPLDDVTAAWATGSDRRVVIVP